MDLVLILQYRGRQGVGWQRQRERPSFQGILEEALRSIERKEVRVQGASRTDAGVHARMQVARAQVERPLPAQRWVKALNGLLPRGMSVRWGGLTPLTFLPRKHCFPKLYVYRFYFSHTPDPFLDEYALRVPQEFSESALFPLLELLRNTRDFAAARRRRANPNASTLSPLLHLDYRQEGQLGHLVVEGNRFLTHEVRILAGTFLDFALGKLTLAGITRALEQGVRSGLGRTLPPYGLTLERVKIPPWSWVDAWPSPSPDLLPTSTIP